MAGLTLPTNNTFSQLNAIKSGANQNSLVSQLYAGSPQVSTKTQTTTPSVVAASSAVKSPTAPTSAPVQPIASTQGSSSLIGNPNANLYNYPATQAPEAPTNAPVSSHTVNNADGSSVTQKYDTSQNLPYTNTNKEMTAQTSAPTPPPTFGGLVGNVSALSQPSTASTQALGTASNAADTYNRLNEQLAQSRKTQAQELGRIGSLPIGVGDQTGRAQVASLQFEREQDALAQEAAGATALYGPSIGAATTGTGQQITAAQGAASLAQPTQVPYNNQYINPLNGQPVGGGTTGQLPTDAQNAVNSYAQQVKDGKMTREDAESRLNAYGVAGTNALNQALGSGFNTNASNASANTTATGQQIQAAIGPATQALDALQIAFNNLPAIQQTGIPILNQFTQNTAMATGIGRDQASAFQGALQEARSRIDAALVGSIGVNAAAAQASALLPDNMVPSELPAKIAAAKFYLQNQLQSYTGSGSQNGSTSTSGNSVFNW